MKFPLSILNDRILLPVLFDAPSYRIRLKRISFCVDTGSPTTYIDSGTAQIIGIPLNKLKEDEPVVRLGGIKFSSLLMKKVSIKAKNDQSSIYTFDLPKIRVLNPTKTTQEAKNIANSTPPILGLDFLKENKLKLFCDISNDIAYLED